jgi:hypothetical protein
MTLRYAKSEYRDVFLWFRQEAKYDPERAKALLCQGCREVLHRGGTEFCDDCLDRLRDDCLDRLRKAYAEDWAAYRDAA